MNIFPFYSLPRCSEKMPNIMHITRVVNAESEGEESPIALEADIDNLEDLEASGNDLVEKDKIPPSMFIGPSISFYE